MTSLIRIGILTGWLCSFNGARAAETPAEAPYVNLTLRQIVSRVESRDPDSNVLMPDTVVITLRRETRFDSGVYEQYRLQADDALHQEVDRQQKYQLAQAKRSELYQTKQQHKIEQLSGAKLKFNMSRNTVKKIKGTPLGLQEDRSDRTGKTERWLYADMTLTFVGDSLRDVEMVAPLPAWSEFGKLLDQPVKSPKVQEFVNRFQLREHTKGESGSFFNHEQSPFSLLYSEGKISTIVVRISPSILDPKWAVYTAPLPHGLQRKDKASDVVRRLGKPESRSGNEWVKYDKLGLWIMFDEKTGEISEIYASEPEA